MRLGGAMLLGMALAAGISAPVSSASIRSVPGKSGRVMIQLSGVIVPGDADVFITVVRQAESAGKLIEGVELNSGGGNLGEGARLAAAIRMGKLPTAVASGTLCASACFLAFAAGEPKFAGSAARIGVHKASDKGGAETKASGAATVLMAHFARELGVPSSIIARMIATPPQQIAWLEPRDLHAMGVKTVDDVEQATRVATAPQEVIASQEPAAASAAARVPPKQAMGGSSWNEFIDKVVALSAEQNRGSPILTRTCKEDSKECIMAVAYLLTDGRQGFASAIQDANGKITQREVCESNASNDVRDCVDWDTGAKFRDFKNTKGDWVQGTGE